jgi:hypothetical protein
LPVRAARTPDARIRAPIHLATFQQTRPSSSSGLEAKLHQRGPLLRRCGPGSILRANSAYGPPLEQI